MMGIDRGRVIMPKKIDDEDGMIYVIVRDEDTGQSHYVREGDVESGWKGGSQKIDLIGIDLEEKDEIMLRNHI